MEKIYVKNLNDANPLYISFKNSNPGIGKLKIRAYGANEAVPISGLRIIVSTIYDDIMFVFFDGYTNDSGIVEKIELPTPKYDSDDLVIPKSITYVVDAIYSYDKSEQKFNVNMYDGVCVLQNISIIPSIKERENGN